MGLLNGLLMKILRWMWKSLCQNFYLSIGIPMYNLELTMQRQTVWNTDN
jgi:hypothetical protein